MKEMKSKKYYLILILFLLFNVNCNDEQCADCNDSCLKNSDADVCDIKCKKSLISSDAGCHFCSLDGTNQYYSILGNTCYAKQKCNDDEKIVIGTHECVSSCSGRENYYEMGDFCYPNILTNAEQIGSSYTMKCKFSYYENIDSNGKKELICLADENCPDTFTSYNYDNKQCFSGDCSLLGTNIRRKILPRTVGSTDSIIIRCSVNCLSSEYLKVESSGINLIYTCEDNCSPLLKIIESGVNKCINPSDCSSRGLYKNGEECTDICSSPLLKLTEFGENKCISVNDCKEKNYFKNGDYCVENCSPLLNFEGASEYECISTTTCKGKNYYQNGDNCVENCSQYLKLEGSNENKCISISDCTSQGFYIKEGFCVDTCTSPYLKLITESGEKKCISDTDCISNGLYKNEADQCVYSCLPFSKLIDLDDNKCITSSDCTLKTYYKNGNDCVSYCFPLLKITESGENKCISLPDCTSNGLYTKDDECIRDCSTFSLYKITELGENKCIDSNYCKLKGFYINGDQCVESCSSLLKFTDSSNENKCITSDICTENNYYKKGDYCVQDCSNFSLLKMVENGENICISSAECTSKNLYKNGNDCSLGCSSLLKITESGENKCISFEICKSKGLYKKGDDCVDLNQCNFYYDSECKEACDNAPYLYHEFGKKECISGCVIPFNHLDVSSNICYQDCPSGFVELSGNCASSSTGCYMIENQNPKICYTSDCTEGNRYHNQNSFICRPNCEIDNPGFNFHKEGEFICYNSCSEIASLSGSTIYQKNYICSGSPCSLFSTNSENNNIKICYNSQEECIRDGYFYMKNGNECVYNCETGKFKVDYKTNSENEVIELGKCFDDITSCKNNGYNYYSTIELKCWKFSCPSEMKTNELDSNNLPKDEGGNTCVSECGTTFHRSSGNICKEKCNYENEFYDANSINPNECKTDCGTKYIKIISGENTCVAQSDCPNNNFFINENNYKQCVSVVSGDPDKICDDSVYKFFFDGDDQCYNECSKIGEDGQRHYYFYNTDFKCLDSCKDNDQPEKYGEQIQNGPKQCQDLPSGKFYYEKDNIIRDSCVLFKKDSTNICVEGCEFGEKVYENKCVEYCPSNIAPYFISTTITIFGEEIDIKKCVPDCKEESLDYKYIFKTNNYNNNECMKSCIGEYYIVGDFCYNKCTGTNNFISPSDFTCSNSCGGLNFYEKLSSEYPNIFMCKESCGDKEYYTVDASGKKECFSECPNDYQYIGENNECKQNCDSDGNGHNFIIVKDTPYPIYKCFDICEGNKYYSEQEHLCLNTCLESSTNNKYSITFVNSDGITERRCNDECKKPDGQFLYYKQEDKICLSQCQDSDYKYYLENDYKCKENCPNTHHENGYECVLLCPSAKPYLNDENKCIDNCPSTKPYFIGTFTHGEEDIQKRCINDCTTLYPYFKVITIENYECMAECSGVYLVNSNPNIIAKKCLTQSTCPDTSPDEAYQYKYQNGNNLECYSICPTPKYYIDFTQYTDYSYPFAKTCLSNCPDEYYFHEENSYKCIKPEHCSTGFADYDTRLCIESCPSSRYIFEIKDSSLNVIGKVCLNSCNLIYGPYITPDKKCVANCPSSEYLVEDEDSFNCKCQQYYYRDDNHIMKCIEPNTINDCKENAGALSEYIIKRGHSNECLKNCDNGIFSVNKDICYDIPYDCSEEENTELVTLSNGQKKCNCKYKYIYESGIKLCLGIDDDCPPGKLYIPETKGCVDSCPSQYIKNFNNYCLRNCPEHTTISGNTCTCEHYWYSNSNLHFICLTTDECPSTHKLLNPDTKQCVQKCRGMSNNILYLDKCVSSCDSLTSRASIPSFLSEYQLAQYYCLCNNEWYYDIANKQIVCSNTPTTCSSLYPDSRYIIKDTKECVISCPDTYSYSFNSECLHSCELHKIEYHIKKVDNSKICECINLWEYDDDQNIQCLDEYYNYCPNSPIEHVQIVDKKQCLEGNECPSDYPLLFNKKCYKMNNCPENSYYNNNIQQECVCYNLWYQYIDSNLNLPFINCLSQSTNICPMNFAIKYPYQIFRTKECLKEGTLCPENSYIFNYICYENGCPENTREGSYDSTNDLHFCICDTTAGYWYQYSNSSTSNRPYFKCGLEECEGEFKNLYIDGNECLRSCDVKNGQSGEKMVSFRGICYEECPEFTKRKEDFIYECGFYRLSEAENLDDLRNYANIQVRELYTNGNIGGYLFENGETTVQIYGIDKNNNINNKNLIMKSNLAYIDLGTCTNKLFKDSHLSDNDKILVIKYDMKSFNIPRPEETPADPGAATPVDPEPEPETEPDNADIESHYLINPVEYEFFSSLTGEPIDASTCEPKEIIISYPFFYTINKFNSFNDGINANIIQKKYDIGKELNHNNKDIDIFNYNNSVYKDVCVGVEINGKDLVLEDRYENLYLNNINLCEDNCTYYYM